MSIKPVERLRPTAHIAYSGQMPTRWLMASRPKWMTPIVATHEAMLSAAISATARLQGRRLPRSLSRRGIEDVLPIYVPSVKTQ
jgi:hypothetical protein